jgi:DNA polymerase-3 subunit alpha
MKHVEEVGLLKVDFLGLRTLTVLHDATELVEKRHGTSLDLEDSTLDDPDTYQLFSRGETIGIFQFESSGMRDYLRKLRPSSLEDLIAMNALYRPGPLGARMVDDFIDRKHGRKSIKFDHPALESILKSTYGIIVYQEQVMRIASELAGFTLGDADLLRRAMGKNEAEVMEEQRERFVSGAVERSINPATAESIFEQIAYFAGYGFNRSHSAGYALIAYQTGYLKTHYPAEFMAATLSSEMSNSDRVVILIEECRRLGLQVLPPDLNESEEKFTVTSDGIIRFGLGAVKNVGHSAIEAILEARESGGPFANLTDFLERTDLKSVNKRVAESLIAAGTCDGFGAHRAQLMEMLSSELEGAQKRQAERDRGQVSLFDADNGEEVFQNSEAQFPSVPEWSLHEMLSREKAALGFYVSGHPMERYRDEVNAFTSAGLGELDQLMDNSPVTVAGVISGMTRKTKANGNPFAFVMLEDFTGSAESLVFSEPYEQYSELLREDNMVLLKGRLSKREGDTPKVIAQEFMPLSEVRRRLTARMHLLLVSGEDTDLADEALNVLKKHPGNVPVFLHVEHAEEGPPLRLRAEGIGVNPEGNVMEELKAILGEENVWVSG